MQDTLIKAPNRMVRRKNRTRKKLMDAAVELVLEKGYEEVMTDEITEHADVGRRTFYNHFTNKRDCVQAAVKERYADYAQDLESHIELEKCVDANGECDHALVITIMATKVFRAIAEDPLTEKLMLYPRILAEAVEESQRDFIVANVANGLVAGRFSPALPNESLGPITTWSFVGLVMTAINRKSQREDSLVWGEFLLQNLGIHGAEAEAVLQAAAG